jgi:hypothetical protein
VLCDALTRSSRRCRKSALADSTRCRLHGATGGRPKGTPEHPNSRAARLGGRRRWVERMRQAKAAGQIERFPGGRRPRGLPPLSKDPTIRRAQTLVERAMAKKNGTGVPEVPTVPDNVRPWSSLSKGERLSSATDDSLGIGKADPRPWGSGA